MEKPPPPRRGELMERLPHALLLEILARLDVESLCSTAAVCHALRSSASHALSSIRSLDLSGFAPTAQILNTVLSSNKNLCSLTIDCSRLDDSMIEIFTKKHLEELVLLRCSMFSSYIFTVIGEKCCNLRLLSLEMLCQHVLGSPQTCKKPISEMLKRCLYLESLCIKFQSGQDADDYIELVVPKTVKVLLLQPVTDWQASLLIRNNSGDRDLNPPSNSDDVNIFSLRPMNFGLHSLSLVLNRITDELLVIITRNLHHLAELCLEDKPLEEPSLRNDLTNIGLQTLASCTDLTSLSLTRSKQYSPTTFRLVNDMGILLLADGCKRLESIRLGGFSKVTDAGYASVLHSCKNLKRFEIVNAFFLSDLAFHDLSDTPCLLVNVRLMSCNLLTSETLVSLSLCKRLEVLDLPGCRSIADPGLESISKLSKLTILDLAGADITDSGLSAFGGGCTPIASLCLRGCKRITDRGIGLLFRGDNLISETLRTLDLGYMPGLSNKGIIIITKACKNITDLCIRNCFSISDESVVALGSIGGNGCKRRSLKRLDLYNCCGLSVDSFGLLAYPYFCGLRWLGVGSTRLSAKGRAKFVKLSKDRPALGICLSGCQMGCKDGWKFHDGI